MYIALKVLLHFDGSFRPKQRLTALEWELVNQQGVELATVPLVSMDDGDQQKI